jgi:hypothetical protein
MAWFFAADHLSLSAQEGNREVERGFLLVGGVTGAGALLDDQWIFDVSRADTGLCPWISLGSAPEAEVASGVLSYDPANGRLVLAGGWRTDGVGRFASEARYALAVDDLGDGAAWSALPGLPSVTYSSAWVGDDEATIIQPTGQCAATVPVPCFSGDESALLVMLAYWYAGELCEADGEGINGDLWDLNYDHTIHIDPCDPTYTCSRTVSDGSGGTSTIYVEISNGWYEGCADDPQCTDGELSIGADDASVAGLAELGGAIDPVSGRAIYGAGTTGCEGGDCAAWSALFDLDGTGVEARRGANGDAVLELEGTSWSTVHASGVDAPAGWPTPASYGRRAAGSALVGATWAHDTRAWSSGGAELVIVGGTRHQGLGPGLVNVLECDPGLVVCEEMCLGWLGDAQSLDPAYGDEDDGGVTGAATLSTWDGAGWTDHYNLGARLHAGAVGVGGSSVLVVGGSAPDGGTGADDVFIVDLDLDDSTSFASTSDMGDRIGPAVGYDPVTRTGWVFGGASGDYAMYRVESVDSLASGEGVEWSAVDPGRAETPDSLRIDVASTDGAGEEWTVATAFTVGLSCEGDCFVDDLPIMVSTLSATELASLRVDVTLEDGTLFADLPAWRSEPHADEGYTLVTVRLPGILTDGQEATVEVGWTREVVPVASESRCSDRYVSIAPRGSLCLYRYGADTSGTAEDERLDAWSFHLLPAVLEPLAGRAWSVTTHYDLSETLALVAPGECDPTDASCGPYENLTWGGYRATAYRGLQRLADHPGSGVNGLTTWIDSRLTASSGYAWGTSTTASIDSDLAWLEARLGALRNGWHNLVFVRAGHASELASGVTLAGLSTVRAATRENIMLGASKPELTAVHELAHAWVPGWWGTRSTFGTGATWLKEGLPTLLSWARQPGLTWTFRRRDGSSVTLPVRESLYPVARDLVTATCEGTEQDLEAGARYSAVSYRYAPYGLAQAYQTHLGLGGSDAGWWAGIRAWLEANPGAIEPTQVESLLSTYLALPNFYGQWVREGRVGTPLLALSLARTPSSEPPGETGDTATTATDGVVELRQVQHLTETVANGCAADAPLFDDVPWLLGCATDDASGESPFEGCEAARSALNTGVARLLDADAETVPLTRAAGYDELSDDPTWFAVLANDALLPGDVPFAGVESTNPAGRAWRWFLACGDDDLTGDCATDADGDGFPALGDCDDGDALVNPGVLPTSRGTGTDPNCDGWL